jgi:hypothetical protein
MRCIMHGAWWLVHVWWCLLPARCAQVLFGRARHPAIGFTQQARMIRPRPARHLCCRAGEEFPGASEPLLATQWP